MAESKQLTEVSKPWHEELANYLLQNPGATLTTVAKHFGKSLSWISIIKNSDAFKDYYNARREELNAQVDATLVDKVHTLAELSIEALVTKVGHHIEREQEMTTDALRELADMSLTKLGFGQKKGEAAAAPAITIQIGDKEALDSARARMAQLRREEYDKRAETALDITPDSQENDDKAGASAEQAPPAPPSE